MPEGAMPEGAMPEGAMPEGVHHCPTVGRHSRAAPRHTSYQPRTDLAPVRKRELPPYTPGMKIYTRTGDDGQTGLYGGARVDKDDPRVEAYGTVDETNGVIGVARAAGLPEEVDRVLERVQADLFVLGAELSYVPGKEDKLGMSLLESSDAERLESAIDAAEAPLPTLKTFVLPGGSVGAASLHHARAVCRRAERRLLAARRAGPVRDEPIVYLNRLSDLLFVLARRANHEAGVVDVPWVARK